jgi:hypothetical protein
MKKGTRVYVVWEDITASLHSEEDLKPAIAEVCGWVISDTKKYLKIATCRYKDGCDLKDRMTLPKGVIKSMEVI